MKGEGIFNLSGQPLTHEEIGVLDKGLKYAPTKNLHKFYTYIGIQKYVRRLNIKKYFTSNTAKSNKMAQKKRSYIEPCKINQFINPPPKDNKHIDVLKQLVSKDLKDLKIQKKEKPKHKKWHSKIDQKEIPGHPPSG